MRASNFVEAGVAAGTLTGIAVLALNEETRTTAGNTLRAVGEHARTAALNVFGRSLHAIGPIIADEAGTFVSHAGAEVGGLVAGVAGRVEDVTSAIIGRRDRSAA